MYLYSHQYHTFSHTYKCTYTQAHIHMHAHTYKNATKTLALITYACMNTHEQIITIALTFTRFEFYHYLSGLIIIHLLLHHRMIMSSVVSSSHYYGVQFLCTYTPPLKMIVTWMFLALSLVHHPLSQRSCNDRVFAPDLSHICLCVKADRPCKYW